MEKKKLSPSYLAGCFTALFFLVISAILRFPEILSMVVHSPLHTFMLLVIILSMGTLFYNPPKLMSGLVRRIGLIFLVS